MVSTQKKHRHSGVFSTCAQCGYGATPRIELDTVEYGYPNPVILYVHVIVYECTACGFEYTCADANTAHQCAIDYYLKGDE